MTELFEVKKQTMKTQNKQQAKWTQEISNLEVQIPQFEKSLEDHRRKLKEDTTIDFYEIQRRMESGNNLIKLIEKSKKRLAELKEKI